MKYVIGALQWKLPQAPLPFNLALGIATSSVYKYTTVLYLALSIAFKMKTH